MLTLAREGESVSEIETVDLGGMVKEFWQLVETNDATFVVEADRTIRTNPNQFRQLVENLLGEPVGQLSRLIAGIEALLGALFAALLVFVLARTVTW